MICLIFELRVHYNIALQSLSLCYHCLGYLVLLHFAMVVFTDSVCNSLTNYKSSLFYNTL